MNKYPNPDTDTTQCDKFLFVNIFNFNPNGTLNLNIIVCIIFNKCENTHQCYVPKNFMKKEVNLELSISHYIE